MVKKSLVLLLVFLPFTAFAAFSGPSITSTIVNTGKTSGGTATPILVDSSGRQVVVIDADRTQETDGNVTLASTTETTILSAVSGKYLDLESVIVTNTSASGVRVDFRDATSGTVRFSVYAGGGQTTGFVPKKAVKQTTANNNWTAQLSGAVTDVRIFVQAVKN